MAPPHKRLETALGEIGWNASRLAEALDVDASAVSRWLNAKGRPENGHRDAIEAAFGISHLDWLKPREKRAIERLTSAVRKAAA